GHIYLALRPTRAEIGGYYPVDYGPHQHREPERRDRPAERHRWIRRRAPFDILDVGCGTGYDLRGFIGRGCRASGIELDPRAAEAARKEGIDVQCTSVESASFPSGRFHVITMNHALEHVFDPRAAMANLRRMLRPDGVLYLLFPTAGGLQFRLFRDAWYHLDVPRHLQFFTHGTLLRLCRETGLRVLRRATRSGGKGFFRSLRGAAERGAPAAWFHQALRGGPLHLCSKVVLRYVVDGLRLGDVAEYLLAPARPGTSGPP
ncbi:MAG TPA: class I SAM-dependent methyltransferase, partial [Planctomycetota bacterium]|nr:class I SAM-dependent methyltransferase [Planctomycetota bacterium]